MALAVEACKPILSGQFPGTFGILGQSWITLSFLALLVSLFILAFFYIVANFLRNQGLLAWTKFELFQIFGTALIFLFSIVTITMMCNFNMGFLSPEYNMHDAQGNVIHDANGNAVGKNIYQIVDDYLSQLEYLGVILFTYLMKAVKLINFLTRVTWLSNPLGLGMTDNPLEGLGQINQIFFLMVSGFATSYLLLHLQMRMLDYMSIAVLYYLFPFGIFFRSFEPTRGFGGTLIGLSIAFFLFYPVILVFNDYIMSQPYTDIVRGPDGLEAQLQQSNKDVNPTTGIAPTDLNALSDNGMSQVSSEAGTEGMVGGLTTGTFYLLKPVMFFFMAAVALPIINFIVLVEITRSLTKTLGEEIDVTNLTRMI